MSPAFRPNLRSDEWLTPLEAQLPWVCSEERMRAKKLLAIKSRLEVFVNSISLSPSESHSSCQQCEVGEEEEVGSLVKKYLNTWDKGVLDWIRLTHSLAYHFYQGQKKRCKPCTVSMGSVAFWMHRPRYTINNK